MTYLIFMVIYTEEKAEKMLSRYVPVAKSVLAKNVEQAIKIAGKIKFPLVLKIISPKAIHKTEINGIRFASNEDELKKEYADLMKMAKKKRLKPTGILVQELVSGEEVIIGIKKDATFGHVIALGMGGKYVEVFKDITFRVCPIGEKDAESMIQDLKFKKILYGVRGRKAVNMKLLRSVLIKVSKFPLNNKNIEELDINPFIINDKIGKAVDARILTK